MTSHIKGKATQVKLDRGNEARKAQTAELARVREEAKLKADLIRNKVAIVLQPPRYQVGHGQC